jgi:hypothetical protein
LPCVIVVIAVTTIAVALGLSSKSSDVVRIVVAGDAREASLNGSNFYFRLYLDGEWCDLWGRDALFIDNGTHITLMLKDGRAQCRVVSYVGREEGGWIYFEAYNITRRGTVRGVEPFYVQPGVNAVVVYKDYELPNFKALNKTAFFIVVEDGVMKYNAVMVEREISVNREVAMHIINMTAELESRLRSQGVIPAPFKWRYENGRLILEPGVELRFSRPVEKRSVIQDDVTYYFYFEDDVILLPAMDIYKSATYIRERDGGYRLSSLVIAREPLSFLPHPLPEIFKIHPVSTGRGEITVILK